MDDTRKKPDGQPTGEGNSALPVSRRELLFTLGAVVLSGFPGLPLEAGEQPAPHVPLPPGLYQPSLDHLSHALANENLFVPIPPGSQTEYLWPRSAPFRPQAFTQQEFQLIRRLVELILGEDLKNISANPQGNMHTGIYDDVAAWIDLVVASAPRIRTLARTLPADQRALAVACFGSEQPVTDLETFEPERICREGFTWLNKGSRRLFAKGFFDAGPAAQLELVLAISDARQDKSIIHSGTRLFDFLKAEIIRGFFTSPLGLKELGFRGNSFYGSSPGCGLAATTASSPPASEAT